MDPAWSLHSASSCASTDSVAADSFSPQSDSIDKGLVHGRRASVSYDSLCQQYSVQGSTSTPNSVGPSSGSASPLDASNNHANQCCKYNNYDQLDMPWSDKPFIDQSPQFINNYSQIKYDQPVNNYMQTSDSVITLSPFSAHTPSTTTESSESSSTKKKKENKKPVKKTDQKSETSRPAAKSIVSAITKRRLKIRKNNKTEDLGFRLPLSELTVEDLKVICRKHNYAISGTKADLVRRLEPVQETIDIEGILMDAIMEEENSHGNVENTKTIEKTKESKEKTNKFDVAISDYLMQQKKQIDEHRSKSNSVSSCHCNCSGRQGSSDVSKTFVMNNGSGQKQSYTSAVRVPVSGSNSTKTSFKSNGDQEEMTFSFAEMGSGGHFIFEPTSVEFTVNESQECQCKPELAKLDGRYKTEELTAMMKELPQPKNLSDKPHLTAKILAMHEKLISLQQQKVKDLQLAIKQSQKALHCQQKLLETARKPSSGMDKDQFDPSKLGPKNEVGLAQLKKQHMQQYIDHKELQNSEQKIAQEQKRLIAKELEIQEEIHVEQAVEDVVRLIQSNRKTALLVVQLVHKYQTERMQREEKVIPKNDCKCVNTPEHPVVVIDETDDERDVAEEETKKIQKPKPKKSKTVQKKPNKDNKNFAAVMEDIFQTVISETITMTEPKEEDHIQETPEVHVEEVDSTLVDSALVESDCLSYPMSQLPEVSSTDCSLEYNEMYCMPHSVCVPPSYNHGHSHVISTNRTSYPTSAEPAYIQEPIYNTYEYQSNPEEHEQLHYNQPGSYVEVKQDRQMALAEMAEKRRCLREELERIELQERQMTYNEFMEVDEEFGQVDVNVLNNFEFDQQQGDLHDGAFLDDIMDLINNGDRGKHHVNDTDVQATNAIYQELRLTDNQFQPFSSLPQMENFV